MWTILKLLGVYIQIIGGYILPSPLVPAPLVTVLHHYMVPPQNGDTRGGPPSLLAMPLLAATIGNSL